MLPPDILAKHLESLSLTPIEWDGQGVLRHWPSQATQLLGWQADEVLGKRFDEWPFADPTTGNSALLNAFHRLLARQDTDNTVQSLHRAKQGNKLYCCWRNSSVWDDAGNLVSILSLVEDITPQFHEELQRDRQLQHLIQTNRRLKQDCDRFQKNLEDQIAERQQIEVTLQNLVEGTAAVTGLDFFPVLVRRLAFALNSCYAAIAEYTPDQRLHAIATCTDGRVDLNPTVPELPPELIPREPGICEYISHLSSHFPDNKFLSDLSAHSFVGITLTNSQYQVIGTLWALSNKPMRDLDRVQTTLHVFATRAAAELERQHTEAKALQLAMLVENSNDLIAIANLEGYLTYLNMAGQRLIGCSDSLETQPLHLQQLYPAKAWPRVKTWLSRLHQGEAQHGELHLQQFQTQQLIPGLHSLFPLRHSDTSEIMAIATIVNDLTALKQAEADLRSREKQYRNLVDTSQDLIYSLNASHQITFVNPAIQTIYGYQPADVIGKPISKLIFPDHIEQEQQVFQQTLAGEFRFQHEATHIHKNGAPIYVMMNAIALRDQQGNPIGITGTINNITERKQAEQELKASLEEKELLLKEIHHRVKNNLQIISSIFSLQADCHQNEDLLTILADSQARIRAMALVHERLYQAERFTDIDFCEYITSLTQSLLASQTNYSRNIQLHLNLDSIALNIDIAIPCGLLLNELLTNALKHGFPDHQPGQIWVDLIRKDPTSVILQIADNGIGLPTDLDIDRTSSLGLRLVRALIRQIRGDLQVNPVDYPHPVLATAIGPSSHLERDPVRPGTQFFIQFPYPA